MTTRHNQILAVVIILMALLFVRLFALTILQHEEWTAAADGLSVKGLYTPAPRGQIFDRYGRPLATNVQSFSVRFAASDLSNRQINEITETLIEILERNGDRYHDNVPILLEDGDFVYTYQKDIEEWLQSEGMPTWFTAAQAFDELREVYDIDPGLDEFEAQAELQDIYRVYPPISVRNMVFSRDLDKEIFLGRHNLARELTAAEAFAALRVAFGIDEMVWVDGVRTIRKSDMSDEMARKIMAIRSELSAMGYRQYIPAQIASDVSDETVIQIEEMSRNLPGVSIVSEMMRIYPNDSVASHVLGYLGPISEQNRERYVQELGYNANDMIGLDGIEHSHESILKGTDGIKYVQVNVRGELVRVIDEQEPVKGKDVYLTIDLELQKTAEAALAQALEQLQIGGTFESRYGNFSFNTASPNANVGAVVAIEVETGDVLAMASYPDYDPNLFTTGISKEDWNALQSKNPRDSLSPVPLYNVAARTAVQPGSTFKMVTATAAVESGLDPRARLHDGGYVQVGDHRYSCLLWAMSGASHGNINLAQALEVSCNYYFYDIATGRDFYRGRSLGYTTPIDIERVMDYAGRYGLGLPTGIEIRETVVPVPTEERKMAQTKSALRNALLINAERYFKPEVVEDREALRAYIDEIVSWTEENPARSELIGRMSSVGVREDMVVNAADYCKYSFFNFAAMTQGDELNLAIGQGQNAYTPLQMANYIATIGNGGVRNKVNLVSAIEGEEKKEPEVMADLDLATPTDLDEIIHGMRLVSMGSRGTLRSIYSNFPVAIAAKTGTAQKEGRIHPPDEVEYIQANLRRIAPYLSWEDVEAEMARLIENNPDINRNTAVRRAVIGLSNYRVTAERIDEYKERYRPFAWVVAMAPADDPKIAVAVLLFQGTASINAAPVAREVIGAYLRLDRDYEDISLDTIIR